ncbi:hypothetical protein [Rhizosphaericola mali]|uniref:Uncharacterized protein n=1 Tax=Rhizosphaericola mali TaxID=2545455 RepID=A0A5P2G4L3_9BACT|nr:hypothetical protein [Rhizosphaericola mali]QES90127.1 hypothetical protein E0W69_016200 [Rhizosphaericola mali]
MNKGDIDYCIPKEYAKENIPIMKNEDSLLALHLEYNNHSLSKHDKLMANAIGLIPIFQNNGTNQEKLLIIQEKISKFDEEIQSVAAQLDCEGERTDQIANYLDKINQKRTTKLTALSIIAGSLTTILAIAFKNNDTQNATAIIGGLTSSILSIITINPNGKKIIWNQNENILEDVWAEKNIHSFIPESLWYVLNTKQFSNSGEISLVQSIKKRWVDYIFKGHIEQSDIKLYYKNGGTYVAEDLHNKATMLNQMQATLRSIHQDLSNFTTHIDTYYHNQSLVL